ncbi:Oviduct-specific glycoprotein [Manis javanica]|nr:Oviduct-specific glycoprotein [Manis javanica]
MCRNDKMAKTSQGKEWIGYDNAVSLRYKALFLKKVHFGEAMVWTWMLDLADVRAFSVVLAPSPLFPCCMISW